jgi:hypothetical protein
MSSRTASDAIQHALRNGGLERIVRTGVSAKERVRYRLRGSHCPCPERKLNLLSMVCWKLGGLR